MSITTRTNISKKHPELYKAAMQQSRLASEAAQEAGLSPLLIELVKIRASQINGCAYCMRLHTGDAMNHGETIERLAVLAAWRGTSYFNDQERETLRLTEYVTNISTSRDNWPFSDTAPEVLTPDQVSAITWLAISINSLNRVALTSSYQVAPKS